MDRRPRPRRCRSSPTARRRRWPSPIAADLAVFFGRVEGSYRLQVLVAEPARRRARRSSTAAPGTSTPPRATPSSPAPQGLVGLDGFLDAEILPNLAGIGEHVRDEPRRRDRAAGAGARLPRRRAAATAGAARRRRAGPAAGGDRLHADERRRPRPRPALHPDRPGARARPPAPGLRRLPELHRAGQGARLRRDAAHRPLAAARPEPRARPRQLPAPPRADRRAPGRWSSTAATSSTRSIAPCSRPTSPASGSAAACGRTGQDNSIALDREKAFDRVIVPEEAFEELNTAYSRGAARASRSARSSRRCRLDAAARAALRADLAERYGRPFDRLAVSLLGSGVAAARGTQVQALCGLFERRSDTLHLVVVWPNATLEPGWFGWRNTPRRAHRPRRGARRRRRRRGDRGRLQLVPRGALQPRRRRSSCRRPAASWTTSAPAPAPPATAASRRWSRRTS